MALQPRVRHCFRGLSAGFDGEVEVRAAKRSWMEQFLPEAVQPYALLARFDKPIGIWLAAWPFMWGTGVAASPGHLPDFRVIFLLGCMSPILRGFACTINDYFDRDIDKMVERTKLRPLACGLLTPAQALIFLALQVLLGSIFLLQLNYISRILGMIITIMAFIYPLMKRITYWPQAFLAASVGAETLMGWAAIRGGLDLPIVLPLYCSCLFWVIVYDTIYAHQDKKDDEKIGVKSTALKFGNQTKIWISGFGVACITNLALSGHNASLGWPYYVFLGAAAGQLSWQILTVDLSNPDACGRKFVSNKWFGALVSVGIVFGRLTS